MKKIIPIIFLTFFYIAAWPQDRPLRVEIEAKSNSDSYVIIPFGEKGVLLFCQSNEYTDRQNRKWNFTMYNTNFKELWTQDQTVLRDLKFEYFDYSDRYLYLYLENSKSSSAKGSFQILKIDIDSATIQVLNSSIPIKSAVTGFKVINNVAMLSGRTIPGWGSRLAQTFLNITLLPTLTGFMLIKYKPFLFLYNMDYGTTKIISDQFKEQAYVESLSVDDKDSVFVANIKNHIPRKTNAMYIDKFNTGGSKISTVKLETKNDGRKLNTAKIIAISENEKIIIGTYNNITKGNKANPAFAGFTEPSTGIYFSSIINEEQQSIKYYNFSKFKTFYSYLSEHRTLKLLKKAKKKELKGGELSFDYRLLVHDIIKRDSSYIMVAEAYYPEYHTVSRTTYDAYGRPMITTYTVFDGYRYTNAIIACFDKEGELLWDNSFEIWNILTYNLTERVKVLLDGDDIILAYSNAGNIATKIISNNEVIEGKQYTKIETSYNDDKVLNDYNSDMEYWYENYFISYGYQKIRNRTQDKTKRTVFYFNKMAFQ